MSEGALILVCDHRGAGIAETLSGLGLAGYRLETSSSLRSTIARLRSDPPDLIVLDPLSQGGSVELEAVDEARRSEPPTPLLVVADQESPTLPLQATRAIRNGSWDVIWRAASPEEFRMRVKRLEDEGERFGEIKELRHRASHDDRTDLLRPHAFEQRLEEHFSAAQRHHFDLALILIDLDKFGSVNKLYDHTVGDELIVRVGEAIRSSLRAEDVAGRLGGDEFGVLLPYTNKVDTARVVARLRDEIHALTGPFPGVEDSIPVSASIGFETYDGKDLENIATLRSHSERALRVAKTSGGNRGVYFRELRATPPADPGSDL